MRTHTTTLYLCMLFLCALVAASEPDIGADTADEVATNSAGNQDDANAKHENIIDRVFSPLDNTVSDINHRLNEGDGSAAPESNE